jgi:PhzF family phenazine biosynthesis protein
MRIPLFHVNAFTDQPFTGNPAAICPLNSWLDVRMLRKVAIENNLSATAFLVPQADFYDLRWFTVRSEIRLCGHATLASAWLVFNRLNPELETVVFKTRFSGPLTVHRDGSGLSMDFPAIFPTVCETLPDGLLQALGSAPPSEVLEANDTYFAVYETENAIRTIRPDFARLEQLHPFAVAVTAPGDTADFVSRYFAPSYGVPEDPVTGSAHCVLTPYWTKQLGKTHLHAIQVSERGGELWCEMSGDRVVLRGSALLTLQGELEI